MLLCYGNYFFSPLNAWNTVNVPDSEGLLQHGIVIDVLDYGLVVDFGCPERRAETVPYGKIFDCSKSQLMQEFHRDAHNPVFVKNLAVEVLVRTGIKSPWRWFPGVLLDFDQEWQMCGWVELIVGNVLVREFFPALQIRTPLELESCVITNGSYTTTTCVLPNACHGFTPEHSPDVWKLFCRDLQLEHKIRPIEIMSDTIRYYQRSGHVPILTEQIEAIFLNNKEDVQYGVEHGRTLSGQHWVRDAAGPTEPLTTDPTDLHVDELPLELLEEVFQALDSVDRIKCGLVCATWNAIIHTDTTFQDIKLSFRRSGKCCPPACCDRVSEFMVAAFVHKCLTPYTKRVILLNARHIQIPASLVLIKLATDAMKHPTRKLQVVAASCDWGQYLDVDLDVADICNACATAEPVVDSLLLKNCSYGHWKTPNISVSKALITLDWAWTTPVDLQTDVWNLFDKDLAPVSAREIAQWIAGEMHREPEATRGIRKILREWQQYDPRPPGCYFGYFWTHDDLPSLDVTKLSKVTLSLLDYEMKHRVRGESDATDFDDEEFQPQDNGDDMEVDDAGMDIQDDGALGHGDMDL